MKHLQVVRVSVCRCDEPCYEPGATGYRCVCCGGVPPRGWMPVTVSNVPVHEQDKCTACNGTGHWYGVECFACEGRGTAK